MVLTSVCRELDDSLTGRVIAASGEVVRKLHNVKDAQVGRDAFAKVGGTSWMGCFCQGERHKLDEMLLPR